MHSDRVADRIHIRKTSFKFLTSWESYASYCDATSVHGLKYLSERRRPLYERLLWLWGIALSMVVCGALLYQTWAKWMASNIIVTMDDQQRAVWDVPFPAVTICPETKIRRSAFDFFGVYCKQPNVSLEENSTFYNLAIQCKQIHLDDDVFKNSSTIDLIEKHSLELIDTIAITDADTHFYRFEPLLTEEGLCYTYNMLPRQHIFPNDTFHYERDYLGYAVQDVQWSAAKGFSPQEGVRSYPRRAVGAGVPSGLSLQLTLDKSDVDIFCSGLAEGFKVTLHSPDEFPRPAQNWLRVSPNAEAQIVVAAHEMRADDALRRYSAAQRQCYFAGDRQLRFFKHYTQQNCELECLANVTRRLCDCVAFHMPREIGTQVCGGRKYMCMKLAERAFRQLESGLKQDEQEHPSVLRVLSELRPCSCLAACNRVVYHSQRSQSEANIDAFVKAHRADIDNRLSNSREMIILKSYNESKLSSTISIYFEETYFIPTRRMELFGTIDFLANCGGLLGLCLGMSVLSLVEIFYWLCVRPCHRRRKIYHEDKNEPRTYPLNNQILNNCVV